MAREGLDAAGLRPGEVDRFLTAHRAAGYRWLRSARGMRPLLGYVRALGAVPAPEQLVGGPAEALLRGFRDHLVVERGMGAPSAEVYATAVRPFVVDRFAVEGGLRILRPVDVMAFVAAAARQRAPRSVQLLTSALRALLRYCHLQGVTGAALSDAVPTVASRQSGLAQPLRAEQVRALLASCDPGCPVGLRDLAILTVLARLGLRRGEVAGLRLDDIDWQCGELTVRGKGGRLDRLPLPVDVGERIAAYLRFGQPVTAQDRCVFIRARAPHCGLTSAGLGQVVATAARRGGLGVIHPHRLRHSVATAMLAEGASLAEVGQLLRHRRHETTAIYAKVDTEALRALARPWPGRAL